MLGSAGIRCNYSLTLALAGPRRDGSPPEEPLEPGTAEWALHEPVTEVDSRDLATPDSWVPRHPDLIRLTGRCAAPGVCFSVPVTARQGCAVSAVHTTGSQDHL